MANGEVSFDALSGPLQEGRPAPDGVHPGRGAGEGEDIFIRFAFARADVEGILADGMGIFRGADQAPPVKVHFI